jgi:transposase
MNDGKTQEEIAAFIGVSQRTVAYWCRQGEPDNIESLEDGRRKREYRKVN